MAPAVDNGAARPKRVARGALGALILAVLVGGDLRADSIEAGPSEIVVDSALQAAVQAFEKHARSWMADLEKSEAENRRTAAVYSIDTEQVIRFDGYGDEFETQVKPTGHAGAPFVGILRYKEHVYTCMVQNTSRCTVSHSVPVSEIFSYKNGRWTY